MKTNQEKLTDALGMLREDTLHTAVTDSDVRPTPTFTGGSWIRRRVAVLVAAGLALTLTAGALLAIPLFRPKSVTPPELTPSDTPTTTPPILSELSWYDEPLVNVQVLAVMPENLQEANDSVSPESVTAEGASVVLGDDMINQQVYVLFQVKEGETVTAYSHNGRIGQGIFAESDDPRTFDSWYEQFLYHTAHHMVACPDGSYEVTVDPANPFIFWGGNRYYAENPLGGIPDEDFIDFITRDADGHITGAGSIYLGNRKTVENTASRYYDMVSISRGTVLGSVRFDEPEAVTEEQAAAFLESLHGKAAPLRDTLFDGPTMGERFIMALGDIINRDYASYNNFGMILGYSGGSRYRHVVIVGPSASEMEDRDYLLFEDGAWAQAAERVRFCEYCGEMEMSLSDTCAHIGFLHQRFKLTDGRIVDIHNDGKGAYPVFVVDSTYRPVTDRELLAGLMPTDSPLLDEVCTAYAGIQAQLTGKVTVRDVIHHSLPAFVFGEAVWDRYAILEVQEYQAIRRYFIDENGCFFEISSVRYGCEICDFTSTNECEAADHEHGNTFTVFDLTDGGCFTLPDGYTNGKAPAPVYTPAEP